LHSHELRAEADAVITARCCSVANPIQICEFIHGNRASFFSCERDHDDRAAEISESFNGTYSAFTFTIL
jgi:hypothetical protein